MLLDFLTALYHFGNDYYSGQRDPLYRQQCLAQYYARREFGQSLTLDRELTLPQAKIYFALAEKHGFANATPLRG